MKVEISIKDELLPDLVRFGFEDKPKITLLIQQVTDSTLPKALKALADHLDAPKIQSGRPNIEANFALLLPIREKGDNGQPLGWMRVCQKFLDVTGVPISKRTAVRRYRELKYS
jgi:hypothetical protein